MFHACGEPTRNERITADVLGGREGFNLMDFVDRIAADIKRGQIRNPDDEVIATIERQFQHGPSADDS